MHESQQYNIIMLYNDVTLQATLDLFRFFVFFVKVGPHVEVRKQNNQSDQVNSMDPQMVSTEATISVQGLHYINH